MSPETRAKVEAAKARIAAAKAAMEKKDDSNQQSVGSTGTVPTETRGARSADSSEAGSVANIAGVAATAGSNVGPSVHSEGAQEVDGTVQSSQLAVVVDVQPADVVVVERPAPDRDGSAEHAGVSSTGESETELDRNNPIHGAFLQRLADLEQALLDRDPMMPTHLREIHKTLIEYEEIMPLLTVDEISKIMSAQQTHVATFLRQEVVKSSKASASKRTAKVTLDDV